MRCLENFAKNFLRKNFVWNFPFYRTQIDVIHFTVLCSWGNFHTILFLLSCWREKFSRHVVSVRFRRKFKEILKLKSYVYHKGTNEIFP